MSARISLPASKPKRQLRLRSGGFLRPEPSQEWVREIRIFTRHSCGGFGTWLRGKADGSGSCCPGPLLPRRDPPPSRKELLASAEAVDLTMLVNTSRWAFDMEPRYTIGLTAITRREGGRESELRLSGPYSSLKRFRGGAKKAPVTFRAREVEAWNDTASLPLLPSDESVEVFAQLRRSPRLDLNDGVGWRARPQRELDATNDKHVMDVESEECPEGFWPVYKGESFDLWTPDTGTYYAWADPERMLNHLQGKRARARGRGAFAEFDAEWRADPDTLPCLRPRIAFRDISRATDSRTVRAALVPPRVFLTNTAPYLLWPRGMERDQAYLLGVLSSLPLDWYARRFVETHVNFFVLNPFPVPRPDEQRLPRDRVISLAGRLAAPDARFAGWAERLGVGCAPLESEEKEDHIRELDAVVARLYGLGRGSARPHLRDLPRGMGLRGAPAGHTGPLPGMEGFRMTHPEFVDNQDGNTLEQALRERLDHLLGTLREPPAVSIATGYFNPGGFGRLADVLRRASGVRLLLGAEPVPAARLPERRLGEPRGERYDKKLADEELEHAERRLRRDRDRLPFSPRSRAAVGELLEFLDSGKIEVRRYEHRFLHGKAFLFSGKHGVLAGSSNFTLAGLTTNLELNLGQYQPGVVARVEEWFDRLWNDAVPYDLAAIYREQFAEHPPYLIYLRALWERYGDELEEEARETGRIQLTRFQTDGVFRAKRILEEYNGVLVADSVGLGKSFIAADLFTEVIERNRPAGAAHRTRPASGRDVGAVQEALPGRNRGGVIRAARE